MPLTKSSLAVGFVLLLATSARAGCIGPVIMGDCKGQEVPWDTHEQVNQQPRADPPAGFYWDWRSNQEEMQRQPNGINPFTGRDANDSTWLQRHAPEAPPTQDENDNDE